MRLLRLSFILPLVLAAAIQLPAGAHSGQVKLATVVPNGSLWHQALKQMGADWRQATEGRIRLVIYAGGVQGDQATIIRRMRFNQLQAAALTVGGLSKIEESFNIFGIPFFFSSDEELLYVINKLAPVLEKRLAAKGFYLLNLGHGGWVQVFTKKKVQTLSDLKKVKLFTSAGEDRMVQWYKSNGFHPVALSLSDVMMGLQTGRVEAVPSPPLAALAFQWYRQTPFMLEVGLAPVVGATIITRKAWNQISERDREKLSQSAAKVEKFLETEVPKQDKKSVAEMEKRGLKITRVAPEDQADFRLAAEELASTMRGSMVSQEIFDRALREREVFRRNASREGPP